MLLLSSLPPLALLALLRSAAAASSTFHLLDSKFSLQSIDGTARLSSPFSLDKPPSVPSPLSLHPDDIVRLTLTLSSPASSRPASSDDDAAAAAPPPTKRATVHQVFAVLTDAADLTNQVTFPLPVKPATGKVSWSLRMDRFPAALLSSSGQVKLQLLLGTFDSSPAVSLPIATLSLPPALLRSPDSVAPTARQLASIQHSFLALPERRHTFAAPPTEHMPPRIVSSTAALVTVVVPWLVLAGLLAPLLPTLSLSLPSPTLVGFLVLVLGLDVLALRYYLGGPAFTLFNMLPRLLVVGSLALLVGRSGLRELGALRKGLRK